MYSATRGILSRFLRKKCESRMYETHLHPLPPYTLRWRTGHLRKAVFFADWDTWLNRCDDRTRDTVCKIPFSRQHTLRFENQINFILLWDYCVVDNKRQSFTTPSDLTFVAMTVKGDSTEVTILRMQQNDKLLDEIAVIWRRFED